MEFLLQLDSTAKRSDSTALIIVCVFVFIICVVAWQIKVSQDYQQAKDEFQRNPTDRSKKQQLINAAKAKNDDGRSALEVISLIEDQNDAEERRKPKAKDFVAELKTLSDLHETGALSDSEFEAAKAKLLK